MNLTFGFENVNFSYQNPTLRRGFSDLSLTLSDWILFCTFADVEVCR